MNFPTNPTINSTYTIANKTWIWDGFTWTLKPPTITDVNNNLNIIGNVTAVSFIKTGGTGTQFLMANGTVDTYGTTAGSVAEGNHVHTFASLTSRPTTLGGYGIIDGITLNTAQSVTATKTFNVTQIFEKTITNTSPATQPIYIKGTGGSTVGTSPAIGFINPALNDGSIVLHNAMFKFMDWQMVTYLPVQSTKFDLGNGWDLRASGTELHFFYNGVKKGGFTTDGFYSMGEVTAYTT